MEIGEVTYTKPPLTDPLDESTAQEQTGRLGLGMGNGKLRRPASNLTARVCSWLSVGKSQSGRHPLPCSISPFPS